MDSINNEKDEIKNLLGTLNFKFGGTSLSDEIFYFDEEPTNDNLNLILNSKSDNIKVKFGYGNYDNIFSIISYLNKCNKDISFTIYLKQKEDKNIFNEYVFNNLNNLPVSKIKIIQKERIMEDLDFCDYIINESRLLKMVEPAKNLTPLEKYLYAYNIAKNFKPYNSSADNWKDSRALYDLLNNDFMVCRGYTRLLEDLLEKLDISSNNFSVVVEEDNEMYNHSILQFRLKDQKYEIDGIYYADPTRDNDLEKDYYTFSLLTGDEIGYVTPNIDHTIEQLYMSNSMEKFLNKFKELSIKQDKTKILKELLLSLKLLEKEFYDYINQKLLSQENINDIIVEIANFIINMQNKKVDDKIIYSAIKTNYQHFTNVGVEEMDSILLLNDERKKQINLPVLEETEFKKR